MQTTVNYQDMSAVDALWTLYRQQPQPVRDAFRNRVIEQVDVEDMPIVRDREDMIAVSKQRMRDIIDGTERTLDHDEVMRLVDNAIAKAV
ncbi:MAG: hypothetical protein J6X62_01085 [Bacteroidales bacterium]|nr:hypothetical protein [Bacteroidales bacterium]